jgi:hypothetical protein
MGRNMARDPRPVGHGNKDMENNAKKA